MADHIRYIDLAYDPTNSDASAIKLVTTLFPDWAKTSESIEFVRFKDGITNTLMKAINKRPGLSDDQIDAESVLLRAYGNGTDVLIDRDRECTSHSLLARHNLAPPLLARFKNGLLYRFIPGRPCSPEDLRRPTIFKGIAERIAQWHAKLPIDSILPTSSSESPSFLKHSDQLSIPNIWTVIYHWTHALPTVTKQQKDQKDMFLRELAWITSELGHIKGIEGRSLVLGHCDLLSANVIIAPNQHAAHPALHSISSTSPSSSIASSPTTASCLPHQMTSNSRGDEVATVSFIDYEYATPCPAAFDLANHFAEWGGFECDPLSLPSVSQRRTFLAAYLNAYNTILNREASKGENELDRLMAQVDLFRGIPGFYWSIWSLVQAEISSIDFDYPTYSKLRLSEYWAWKNTLLRERGLPVEMEDDDEESLREKRWSETA